MDGRAPRILVVDPKAAHRALLARRLGEEGYAVATADSAAAALAMMHRAGADLVLAELAMPTTDGVAFTRSLRGVAAWSDLPVILISGRSENDGIIRALAGGADDVVVKPFHFEVLTARIARLLERTRFSLEPGAGVVPMDGSFIEPAITFGEPKDGHPAREGEREERT